MREINNSTGNMNPANFQKVESKTDAAHTPEKVQETNSHPNVTEDLSQSPEAIIGRSQVHKADSIENDIKTMLNNPQMVEKTLNFQGLAEKMLRDKGVEAPYEQSTVLANEFRNEFLSK